MIRLLAVAAALLATLVVIPAVARRSRAPRRPPTSRGRCRGCTRRTARTRRSSTSAAPQVLLRGVNVNQLGEYYQANPDLAPTVPLTEDDFREIARLGFNTVRLIVSWSTLEPTPGAYNDGVRREIRQAVGWAASYGLYVVLDMHQDAYGHRGRHPRRT